MPERLIVDYIITFQNARGECKNRKVFKLKQVQLETNQCITINKKHPFRANMTTRALYPGEHRIEIQLNGTIIAQETFILYS